RGVQGGAGDEPTTGHEYREMIRFARALGLDARATVGLEPGRLEAALKAGHPVIVAIQAYATESKVYQDPSRNENGHYLVVIGFDAANYYVEDPSLIGRR